MKKFTIEISANCDERIDPPGSAVAWELISLANILAMLAYKNDEQAIRNRLNWYTAESDNLSIRIKID